MAAHNLGSRQSLISYLKELGMAVLSTVNQDGFPYSAVIYFVVDHNLNFYFLTKADTKKARNLEVNNKAALTTIDLKSMITVQTTGAVARVRDGEQYIYMIGELGKVNAQKNNPHWPPPVSKLKDNGEVAVYKYKPDWIRIADYSHKITDEKKEDSIFTEITP